MRKKSTYLLILMAGLLTTACILCVVLIVSYPPRTAKDNSISTPEDMAAELEKRGENMYRQKLYVPLIATYQKMLAQLPDNVDLKKKLAFAYFGAGQYDKAKPLLLEAAQDATIADAEAFYELGFIVFNEGDLQAARGYLKRALELNPNHTKAKELLDKMS